MKEIPSSVVLLLAFKKKKTPIRSASSIDPRRAVPSTSRVHNLMAPNARAKQVMLFRLRAHQSYAVVFSFLSTMYSLYEYAAQGIPYR